MKNANYPERLISSEEKIKYTEGKACDDCTFIHRVNDDVPLLTLGGVIDPYVINYDRFCDLSINTLFCNNKTLRHLVTEDDVKFSITGEKKKEHAFEEFKSDTQIPKTEDIEFTYDTDINIIGFLKRNLESIEGIYPFKKGGKKEEEEYDYKIKIEYVPTPVNTYHYEVHVYGNHKDKRLKFSKIKGTTSKKYIESIITSIRNRIIKNNFLFEVRNFSKNNF